MDKVAILLSTYNGERYLREQIDSILNQKNVDVDLYVRDDGSHDRTIELLKDYAEANTRIYAQYGKNVGVANSFMELLYRAPAKYDYYAFSDQDDIWEADKIQEAIKQLKATGAALYGSNQACVDKNGKSLNMRYSTTEKIHLDPISILNENMIAGCTMVFPNWFWRILSDENTRPSEALLRVRIHDVWTAEVAAVCGTITYDPRSFIKYRQHENNVVGAKRAGLRENIAAKVKKIRISEYRNGRSKLAKEICELFPEQSKKYPVLQRCANTGTLAGRLKLIQDIPELCGFSGECTLSLLIKILCGVF